MATSVLITTEGTYPYFKGGVSIWCDQLIRGLPEVEFHIFAVVPSPKQPLSFALPVNVKSCRPFPLWGTEIPGRQEAVFSRTYARRLRTTSGIIEREFGRAFAVVVRSLVSLHSDPEPLARALLALQDYFEEFDYARTMTSPEAWSIFLDGCSRHLDPGERPNLEEATICMRWLLRYLSVLALPYPRVEIVHASMAGLAAVPGTLSKLRNGTAFLLSEHGIYLRELYLHLKDMPFSFRCRRFLHGLNAALVRMNYHYADAVTSLGNFNTRWQERSGANPRKLLFVPNGVDAETFQPRKEALPSRLTVVTLARVHPLKGIDTLLEAAAIVRRVLPSVRFRVLGDIADPEYYRQCLDVIARHDLGPVVEWGETSNPAEAYNAAHVFVLPSISEGMPYAILEAMLSACPVVATDVGNVADVLAGTGLLVRPKDHEGLASALLHLLHGPQSHVFRTQLADRALRRARSMYTVEKCIGRFHQLYEVLTPCAATYQSA